jgi:hypothetical protein
MRQPQQVFHHWDEKQSQNAIKMLNTMSEVSFDEGCGACKCLYVNMGYGQTSFLGALLYRVQYVIDIKAIQKPSKTDCTFCEHVGVLSWNLFRPEAR